MSEKENTKKTVVTIIEEYTLDDGNTISAIKSVTRSLLINDEQVYSEKAKHSQAGILYEITNRLCYLTGDKKPKSSSDVSSDAGYLLNSVGHRGFEGFNFKQQLLYIFLKKFFLGGKATSPDKVVGIYFYGNLYSTTETSRNTHEASGFEVPKD